MESDGLWEEPHLHLHLHGGGRHTSDLTHRAKNAGSSFGEFASLAARRVPLDASKMSMKVKTMGLVETAEGRLDLTTNLEGCHCEGKEVSP